MFGSILFFSFAEEAVTDRELKHQKFVFNAILRKTSLICSRFGSPVVHPSTRAHKTAGNRATSFPGVREVPVKEVGNRAHRKTDSNFYPTAIFMLA